MFDIGIDLQQMNSEYPSRIHNFNKQDRKRKNDFYLPKLQIEDIVNHLDLKLFLEDLKCPICINLIEDPKTCINCETNYCGSCIKEWLGQEGETKCPCCRDEGQEQFLHLRDRQSILFSRVENNQNKYVNCTKMFKKVLNSIEIVCHNEGCNSIIKMDERYSHIKACLYQQYNCPNDKCQEKVTKLTETDHSLVCQYRKQACRFCKLELCVKDISFHEEICDENKKKCVDCKEDVQIHQMDRHEKICLFKQITCLKCNSQFFRKDHSLHTKAKCFEKLYNSSQKDIKKREKVISIKDQQIATAMSLLDRLKASLISQDIDKNVLLKQIEDFSSTYNSNLIENIIDESTENYPDDFESFENTIIFNIDKPQDKIQFYGNDLYEQEMPYVKCQFNKLIGNNVLPDNLLYPLNNSICNALNRNEESYYDFFENDEEKAQQEEQEEIGNNRNIHNLQGNEQEHFEEQNKFNLSDDSYFQDFANSFDKKLFFNGVEENLLL